MFFKNIKVDKLADEEEKLAEEDNLIQTQTFNTTIHSIKTNDLDNDATTLKSPNSSSDEDSLPYQPNKKSKY